MREQTIVLQILRMLHNQGERITTENLTLEVGLVHREYQNATKNVPLALCNICTEGGTELVEATLAIFGSKTGKRGNSKTPAFAVNMNLPVVDHTTARNQLLRVGHRYCAANKITNISQAQNMARTIADQLGRPLSEAMIEVANAKSEWDTAKNEAYADFQETVAVLANQIKALTGPSTASMTLPIPTSSKPPVPQR